MTADEYEAFCLRQLYTLEWQKEHTDLADSHRAPYESGGWSEEDLATLSTLHMLLEWADGLAESASSPADKEEAVCRSYVWRALPVSNELLKEVIRRSGIDRRLYVIEGIGSKFQPGDPQREFLPAYPRRTGLRETVLAVLVAAILSLAAIAQPQTITGKVVGVSDGDTITVLDDQKRQHKIRLDGIDAPESSQDYGARAKQSLSDLVFGKTVTVITSKKDRYGRVLGKVTLDGKNINMEQVSRGFAWFYRHYARDLSPQDAKAYDLSEAKAKTEKRGLWADPSPTPPWDFRRGGRTARALGVKPPTSKAEGAVIGNRNSNIYHLSNCPDYSKVAERNRVPFATEAEAQAAGYRKARNCPQ